MNKKQKTLFEKEMENSRFKSAFEQERTEFELELQMLQALEDSGLIYEDFAKKVGTSKGNVSRDLRVGGLKKASLDRIQRMAAALNMDCITILLPKSPRKRRQKIANILKKVS